MTPSPDLYPPSPKPPKPPKPALRGLEALAVEVDRRPAHVSYYDAFFSQGSSKLTDFEGMFEAEAACFHEAGHAVAGLQFAHGVSRVSVSIECRPMDGDERLGYAFGGRYEGAKRPAAKIKREIEQTGYGRAALASAVVTCAGPAAELRYRREVGVPLRMLGGTIGDHDAVDGIAKHLERQHGRDRFAFRRLAWREAWKLIHRPEVWRAVSELAYTLHEGMEWPEEPGTETYALPGAMVRAIVRRAITPIAA